MKLSISSRAILAKALVMEIKHRSKYPDIAPFLTALTLSELLHDLGGLGAEW